MSRINLQINQRIKVYSNLKQLNIFYIHFSKNMKSFMYFLKILIAPEFVPTTCLFLFSIVTDLYHAIQLFKELSSRKKHIEHPLIVYKVVDKIPSSVNPLCECINLKKYH